VVGTGRAADRQAALDFGAQEFVDRHRRRDPEAVHRLDSSRRNDGDHRRVSTLDDAVAAFNPTERIEGKTIIPVRP
jgi:hypothetical protein